MRSLYRFNQRSGAFNIRRRSLATLAKQEKLPTTVLPPASAPAEIADMELTQMNVTTVYLETYDPILRDLRDNLNDVNKKHIAKSVSFLGWSNAAGKAAKKKINALAAEVDFISDKMSSFCNRVNHASNDNFNILFQNINALTDKLENENLSKEQIATELKQQQALVGNMKKDISILQVTLEDAQNALKLKTAQYDKVVAELKDEIRALEKENKETQQELAAAMDDLKEARLVLQETNQKLEEELKAMTVVAEDTKNKLKEALESAQGLEAELEDLEGTNTEVNGKYSKYKRRVWVAFTVYTALMAGAAAWFYTVTQEEAESHVKKLEIKKERMERVFTTKQEKVEQRLKQKEMEMEALQKQLTDANNRGLWSYIFG